MLNYNIRICVSKFSHLKNRCTLLNILITELVNFYYKGLKSFNSLNGKLKCEAVNAENSESLSFIDFLEILLPPILAPMILLLFIFSITGL